MPLGIKSSVGQIQLKFDNVVSLWALLKEMIDTPYLYNFIIENYAGGNTLVPKKVWDDDGVMYQEFSEGRYFFPYQSIGFVFDDTIESADIYVIDDYEPGMDYQSRNLFMISIRNTDEMTVVFSDKNRQMRVIALYLLSSMKIDFDKKLLLSIEALLKSFWNPKLNWIAYMPSTIIIGMNSIDFVVRVIDDEKNSQYYQFTCGQKVGKRAIKETEIRNLGYLKKKLYHKHPQLQYILWGTVGLALIAIPLVLPKIFDNIRMSSILNIYVGLVVILAIAWATRKIIRSVMISNMKKDIGETKE